MGKRYSQEYMYNYFKKYGYELLTDYKNNKQKLRLKCPNGHITEKLTYDGFNRGNNRCPECKLRFKYKYDDVKFAIEREGYELITKEKDYKNVHTKLEVKLNDGEIRTITYGHFLEGKRFGKSFSETKLTYDYIKSEIEKCNYTLLSKDYISSQSKLEVICNKGHYTNTITWNNFQRGQRCKICNSSKGERKIRDWLETNNVKFIPQKEFEGLVGLRGGNLSYDFYLPKYNLLIEYQGEFHDGTVSKQTKDEFLRQQEHDKRKVEYAYNHNIKLLEIWYWDFDNIEEILNKEINLLD